MQLHSAALQSGLPGERSHTPTGACRTLLHRGLAHLPGLVAVAVRPWTSIRCSYRCVSPRRVRACDCPLEGLCGADRLWKAWWRRRHSQCRQLPAHAAACPRSSLTLAEEVPRSATCSGRAFPVFALFSAGAFQLIWGFACTFSALVQSFWLQRSAFSVHSMMPASANNPGACDLSFLSPHSEGVLSARVPAP